MIAQPAGRGGPGRRGARRLRALVARRPVLGAGHSALLRQGCLFRGPRAPAGPGLRARPLCCRWPWATRPLGPRAGRRRAQAAHRRTTGAGLGRAARRSRRRRQTCAAAPEERAPGAGRGVRAARQVQFVPCAGARCWRWPASSEPRVSPPCAQLVTATRATVGPRQPGAMPAPCPPVHQQLVYDLALPFLHWRRRPRGGRQERRHEQERQHAAAAVVHLGPRASPASPRCGPLGRWHRGHRAPSTTGRS
jgi:hypothetical protein